MPMRRRTASMSQSGSVMSMPSTRTTPDVGSSRRFTHRSSVDLPDPDGPMMHTTSPSAHREVDALQHLQVAERLAQLGDLDGRRRRVDDGHRACRLRRSSSATARVSGTVTIEVGERGGEQGRDVERPVHAVAGERVIS